MGFFFWKRKKYTFGKFLKIFIIHNIIFIWDKAFAQFFDKFKIKFNLFEKFKTYYLQFFYNL